MAPTIVENVDPSMAIAREEIFGLIVAALTFETVAEAIELATSRILRCFWIRGVNTAIGAGRGVGAGAVWVNTFMDGTLLLATITRASAVS
jgi:betaine-aldehyde dehydrogenase